MGLCKECKGCVHADKDDGLCYVDKEFGKNTARCVLHEFQHYRGD